MACGMTCDCRAPPSSWATPSAASDRQFPGVSGQSEEWVAAADEAADEAASVLFPATATGDSGCTGRVHGSFLSTESSL